MDEPEVMVEFDWSVPPLPEPLVGPFPSEEGARSWLAQSFPTGLYGCRMRKALSPFDCFRAEAKAGKQARFRLDRHRALLEDDDEHWGWQYVVGVLQDFGWTRKNVIRSLDAYERVFVKDGAHVSVQYRYSYRTVDGVEQPYVVGGEEFTLLSLDLWLGCEESRWSPKGTKPDWPLLADGRRKGFLHALEAAETLIEQTRTSDGRSR